MLKFYLVGYFLLLCFDTLAAVSFKLGAVHAAPVELNAIWLAKVFSEKWLYIAIVGYLGAFASYISILKRTPVGSAFAASHMEVVTVLLASVAFLHEQLSLVQVVGSLFIVAGVIMLLIQESAKKQQSL